MDTIRKLKEKPREYSENTLAVEDIVGGHTTGSHHRHINFDFEDKNYDFDAKSPRKSLDDETIFSSKRKMRKTK